jgi:S-adenosylmethionine synthetase
MAESVFTSESVTAGHPDKACDQISDAVVDRVLQQDPLARVVAECAVSTAIVFLAVHADRELEVDLPGTVRDVLRELGYDRADFDWRSSTIMTNLTSEEASPEARQRGAIEAELYAAAPSDPVEDLLDRLPAQDQVTTFGYACRQSTGYVPLPIWLAHRITRRLAAVQRAGTLPYLGPDGKVQVGVRYRDRRPVRVDGLTMVVTGDPGRDPGGARLEADLAEAVVAPAFVGEEVGLDGRSVVAINPGARLEAGGPAQHAGLTGRKTADDTYGAFARTGSAALSGKDPSRIDRTAAYAARHVAKNVVAAGLADECEVQLSYAIGRARPVTVMVRSLGTSTIGDDELTQRVLQIWDLRPAAIVRALGLRGLPRQRHGRFYRHLAAYGHVGRTDLDPPWERVDRADQLRSETVGSRSSHRK